MPRGTIARAAVAAVLCVLALTSCAGSAMPVASGATPGASGSSTPKSVQRASMPAEMALRNVVTAARTLRSDSAQGGFAGVTPTALADIWNDVCYESGHSQAGTCKDGSIIVDVASTPERFGAAAFNESNVCLWISDGPDGVTYGAGFPCSGEAALGASESRWTDGDA